MPWSLGFVLGLPLKSDFLKIIQVTMKHDPFDAMQESMYTLHPSCIHILRWSPMRSVRRTWTGSPFSTNESAWSAMVTGTQSCVWSGPKLATSQSIGDFICIIALLSPNLRASNWMPLVLLDDQICSLIFKRDKYSLLNIILFSFLFF